MRKFSAPLIYPIASAPIENSVIITDDKGKLLAIDSLDNHDKTTVQFSEGVLVPGFVNTHCHLELSHMKGLVDTGTTLIPFITNVVRRRQAEAEVIAQAIAQAEQDMCDGGIVAVGDISNTTDTFATKAKGRLRYYTFVEMFDFLQEEQAQATYDRYYSVYEQIQLAEGSEAACVPHAPYSVSKRLFELINTTNAKQPKLKTISVHNQETQPEQDLFKDKTGGFLSFYGGFGVSLDAFEASGETAIHYLLQNMDATQRTLFVHNTLTSTEDIKATQAWGGDKVFWATCPNANLYIENRLPDYSRFINTNACVTIGTDSLTSNWQLSILDELKTIQRYQSYVPLDTLLHWATLNGAKALGFEQDLGSFEVGKTPGVLQLTNLADNRLTADTQVKRLI